MNNNNAVTLSIEQEKARAIAEIDARATKQKEHQLRLGQLNKQVSAAEGALVEFHSKMNFLRERKTQLLDQLLRLWPASPSDLSLQPQTNPLQSVAESYGTILAIDAALADASRVKKHLDQRLHVAKQALADFQR